MIGFKEEPQKTKKKGEPLEKEKSKKGAAQVVSKKVATSDLQPYLKRQTLKYSELNDFAGLSWIREHLGESGVEAFYTSNIVEAEDPVSKILLEIPSEVSMEIPADYVPINSAEEKTNTFQII